MDTGEGMVYLSWGVFTYTMHQYCVLGKYDLVYGKWNIITRFVESQNMLLHINWQSRIFSQLYLFSPV